MDGYLIFLYISKKKICISPAFKNIDIPKFVNVLSFQGGYLREVSPGVKRVAPISAAPLYSRSKAYSSSVYGARGTVIPVAAHHTPSQHGAHTFPIDRANLSPLSHFFLPSYIYKPLWV